MSDEPVEPIIVSPPTIISISFPSDLSFVSWYVSVYNSLLEYEKDHPEYWGPYSTQIESEVTENPTKPWIIPNLIAAFGSKLTAFHLALGSVTPETVYNIGGGLTTTAAALQATAKNLQRIVIINNGTLPPGYGGQNMGNELRISIGTLNGYLGYGQAGINFLMLHEIAHNTTSGLAVRQQQFKIHTMAGGTSSDFNNGAVPFRVQEARTNYIAQVIAGTAFALPALKSGLGTLADFPPYGTEPF